MDSLVFQPRFTGGNFAEAVDQQFGFDLARENAVRPAAEQVKRELLVGGWRDYHDFNLRRLPQEFGHGFDWIGRKRRFENQNIGREFGYGRLCLGQCLGLSPHPDIVFESKNLPQAGPENCLGISQNHANQLARASVCVSAVIFSHANCCASHQFSCTYARSKWYSSITTPTPRRP